MAQVRDGQLRLGTTVATFLPDWRQDARADVTIQQLLDHSSGLPARVPAWEFTSGREGYRRLIADTRLERAPGSRAVYSDVGLLLLGLLLAPVVGHGPDAIRYRPLADAYERTAPTERDPWRGRVLCGEVHDENAAAIGGVAGHAGLFGTAPAVGAFARLVLETFRSETILGTPELMRQFTARSSVPGSSRALAWDTALPTSSCGTRMSPAAIGHTGFTGTSLWIDAAQDFYAVLLTNRVHPTRTNEKLIPLRAVFHDALPR
jgi:CubicO group peptidase (beta-lactamase class C family)